MNEPCNCPAYNFPHKRNTGKCKDWPTECRCPAVSDPFGTGDHWYKERDCQHPDRCPFDKEQGNV